MLGGVGGWVSFDMIVCKDVGWGILANLVDFV